MAKLDGNRRIYEASLLYVVGRVDQGIRREMRKRLAEGDLSVREYTALLVLHNRPGLSNAQLARRSLIAPQSMIEILAKLERRALVDREVDPAHKLIRRAVLTPGRGSVYSWPPASSNSGCSSSRPVTVSGLIVS